MKSKFQSSEDFMKDYEAYKKGKRYKLVYVNHDLEKRTEYMSNNLLSMRLEAISTYSSDTIGVVDLKHKFEVVCKVE